MPEPHDSLRNAFKDAAEAGQARARPVPASVISERGSRRHRRRLAVVAATACLAFAGTGAAAVTALLPGSDPDTGVPASTPSGFPSVLPSSSPLPSFSSSPTRTTPPASSPPPGLATGSPTGTPPSSPPSTAPEQPLNSSPPPTG
ncbi:hypothetical protein [Streptomyces flavidovirens]|uniref:hypothetical protein n=1 Tax=Streptomyces flavidovirens TaxID=67298 RepID=UPI00142F39AD|nr:hypothetical protein [Streptomyces flavidovirens]